MRNTNTIIQERDRHLLRELSTMRVIDREQAKIVAPFTSNSRANRRLRKLVTAGLLRRFFLGSQALFSLTRKGAWVAEFEYWNPRRSGDEVIVADFFVRHQLAINKVFCALKYRPLPPGMKFERWVSFREPLSRSTRLIPDGYAAVRLSSGETAGMFFEIDLGNEHLKIWTEKANRYLQFAFSGGIELLFGIQRFRVIVVVNSERRRQSIRKMVATVTPKIFWFATAEDVEREGLFAPIWLRPTGDTPVPLVAPPA